MGKVNVVTFKIVVKSKLLVKLPRTIKSTVNGVVGEI